MERIVIFLKEKLSFLKKRILRLIKSIQIKFFYKAEDPIYKLAVVAIIKNEAAYIEEWVKYHRLIGVDKIYLYDNGSTDNTVSLLTPFIDDGFVQLIDFPGIGRQLPAYNDALKRFGKDCRYMAFIDADEFLFNIKNDNSLVELIDSLLEKDSHAGGLAVNWRMFGSSGYIAKPTGGCWITFYTEHLKMAEVITA